jgi:hypothetical protein
MNYTNTQALPDYTDLENHVFTSKIMRLDIGTNKRFYYTKRGGQEPKFFTSVTTFCGEMLPTGKELIKWYAEHGYEKAKEMALEAADYGTFMHIQFGEYLLNRTYNFNTLEKRTENYLRKHNINASKKGQYMSKCYKHLLSLAQWVQDYDVEPVAIEMPVYNHRRRLAGTIDLVCYITVSQKGFWGEVYKAGPRKGQPKETKKEVRILAMVDFKSGKYFYLSHEMQLHVYWMLWQWGYKTEYMIQGLYNWSPVDWKTDTPTYKFKDQTDFDTWKPIIENYIKIGNDPKFGIFNARKTVIMMNENITFGKPVSKTFSKVRVQDFVRMKEKELKGRQIVM